MKRYTASTRPWDAINKVAPSTQPLNRRLYYGGYESFFNQMPVLKDTDELLDSKIAFSNAVMGNLAMELRMNVHVMGMDPGKGNFDRHILGIEEKEEGEGAEIVMAVWGEGHTSPVHGHSAGYIYEAVIKGRVRVNTYQLMENGKVRLVETTIVESGPLINVYNKHEEGRKFLIHNFVALEPTVTLHFLPEHTRDGRDNGFEVEYFEDTYFLTVDDFTRITSQEGMYMRKGDVAMVRSMNVPEYGDHFIVVTGPPVVKPHGLRVQDKALAMSPNGINVLDFYDVNQNGLVLLKLKEKAKNLWHAFHNVQLQEQIDIDNPAEVATFY